MYEVVEHTADRLVMRRYWSGRFQGFHMKAIAMVYICAGTAFAWASGGSDIAWWVRLLVFLGGIALGALFFWLSRGQGKRLDEGMFIFDKKRGVFELRSRTEHGVTRAETYPLNQVQYAYAEDTGSEGYARRLVIVLSGNQGVSLANWGSFVWGETEHASRTINEFLGTATPLA